MFEARRAKPEDAPELSGHSDLSKKSGAGASKPPPPPLQPGASQDEINRHAGQWSEYCEQFRGHAKTEAAEKRDPRNPKSHVDDPNANRLLHGAHSALFPARSPDDNQGNQAPQTYFPVMARAVAQLEKTSGKHIVDWIATHNCDYLNGQNFTTSVGGGDARGQLGFGPMANRWYEAEASKALGGTSRACRPRAGRGRTRSARETPTACSARCARQWIRSTGTRV